MKPYLVMVNTPNVQRGAGPARVFATDEADAKAKFAEGERMTVEQIEALGLTFWTVTLLPEEAE